MTISPHDVNRQHEQKDSAPLSGSLLFDAATWEEIAGALGLSRRELQIVQSVFDDESEPVMARKFSISPHTVHTHLERIYRKLVVQSRVGMVVRVVTEYRQLKESSKR